MQHGGKDDCKVFTLSLGGKLTGNPVEVLEHFRAALRAKPVGFNNGFLDFRSDCLAGANQLRQPLIGLGDPGAHPGAVCLIFRMDLLDFFRACCSLSENSARNQLMGVERFCAKRKTAIAAAKPEAIIAVKTPSPFFISRKPERRD
jgi:hypothetical protein